MKFVGTLPIFKFGSPIHSYVVDAGTFGFEVQYNKPFKGYGILDGLTDQEEIDIARIGQILGLNSIEGYEVDVFDYPILVKLDDGLGLPESLPNQNVIDESGTETQLTTWQEWCSHNSITPLPVGDDQWIPLRGSNRKYMEASIWFSWIADGYELKSLVDFVALQNNTPSE